MSETESYSHIISSLKHQTLIGHQNFIDLIIKKYQNIKDLDNYYQSDFYLKKTIIHELKRNTLLNAFRIQSWEDLIIQACINRYVYDLFERTELLHSSSSSPTPVVLLDACRLFKYLYDDYINPLVIHFLSATSDYYILYCMANWISYNPDKTITDYSFNMQKSDMQILMQLINKDHNTSTYLEILNKVQFLKLKNNNKWVLNEHPIYYKETKIYTMLTTYDGMGWYHIFAISSSPDHKETPFFFALDGGSNHFDRIANEKFFRSNRPSKSQLFKLEKSIELISDGSFSQYLFKSN